MKLKLSILTLFIGLCWSANATIYTVNSANDPGDGVITPTETTLREAITAAVDGDTIRINPGLTINLNAGELVITNEISIEGPGASFATVNGRGVSRVFNILGSSVTISGLRVTGGNADSGGGISVSIRGTQPPFEFARGHLVLTDAEVSGNHASQEGGGIFVAIAGYVENLFTASLVMSNCVIANNTADVGGGLSSHGSVDATLCYFQGNVATNGGGGYVSEGLNFFTGLKTAPNVITRSTFAANTSGANGGAILSFDANFTLGNVTISSNNAAASGGGIYTTCDGLRPGDHTTAALNDVTITGNVADADHNNAGDGGGVFENATNAIVSAENSIIAGNIDNGPLNAPDISGVLTSLDYNLIGNTSGMSFSGPTTHTLINVNPLLGPLASNGFTIPTHALLPGSPAIDSANPATSLAIDERGVTRPQGAGSDMGAFERAVITPPVIESVTVTPNVLWPPNHKLVPVNVSVNAQGELVSCVILGASSNQPVNGKGDGNTAPDIVRTGDLSLLLRAERAGNIKTDRVYTITVLCADTFGNTTRTNVYVTVPHDQGSK